MSRSGSIRVAALRRTFLGSFAPPEVPEDLSGVSDEDLGSLEAAVLEAFNAARQNANSAEAVAELERMATAVERIRAEAQRRYEAAAAAISPEDAQRQADEVAARLAAGGRPGDPGVPPVPAELRDLAALSAEDRQALAANTPEEWAAYRALVGEPAPAPEPQRVIVALPDDFADRMGEAMARALPQPRRGGGLVPFSGIRQPEPAPEPDRRLDPIRPQTAIVAGADVPGFGVGQPLEQMGQVFDALIARRAMFEATPEGVSEKHLVARFRQAELPEERQFAVGDERGNTRKWHRAFGAEDDEPITASGGLCAPVEPYYDILVLAENDRPLRGAFATFNAARGGIRLIPPPKLSDAAGAAGYITMAVDQAALGGSGAQISAATKPCLHVACGTPVEYDVAAITSCLEFGNFTTRTFPEQMPAWMQLAAANQALLAEQKILDALSAVHTQVAEVNDSSLSATSQWLAQVAKYGSYLRNRHRMAPDTPLRLLAPAWAIRMFTADMLFRKWDDPSQIVVAQAEIEGYLRELNANVTWYVDSGTGKNQLVNGGTAITGTPAGPVHFPATVDWHLFPEGSWLRLDSGMLDLGIVRDSSLNSLNNFRIFSETFEAMAYVGLEGLEIVSPLFASGLVAGDAYGSSTAGGTGNVALPTTF